MLNFVSPRSWEVAETGTAESAAEKGEEVGGGMSWPWKLAS